MKFFRRFENHDEYSAYTLTSEYLDDSVNRCILENEIHYNPSVHYVPVESVSLDKHSITLDFNESERLAASVLPSNATNKIVTWSSSDNSIASVTSDGLVTSMASNGNATITVSTMDGGYSDTCSVEVAHDYSKEYLTFRVLSNGTIVWNSIGTGYNKVIQYSINGGEWISITASSSSSIAVSKDDVVRFKGSNASYAGSKANYAGFEGGTATFNIEGNIMSLVYGDDFENNSTLTSTYNFCSIFKLSNVISAENLVLPATTLTQYCYRAMFSFCTSLAVAPKLPATTLAQGCYWYMFESCAIETAPELNAKTLVKECYGNMFINCASLSYIKCVANSGLSAGSGLTNWVSGVSSSGYFVKDKNTVWTTGNSGIPTNWVVYDDNMLYEPTIDCDGERITITCETSEADIYYRLNQSGSYILYSQPIEISENTTVEAYSRNGTNQSSVVREECIYVPHVYKFADLEVSSGPLYYGSNGYEIKDGWNYDSYNQAYGKTIGSYYFNYLEMGELFETSSFSTSDGNIVNKIDSLDGWRLPTNKEWESILGTTRMGSTVNGALRRHYAVVQLSGVSHAGSATPRGILVFPDGESITGVNLANTDSTTPNTGITEAQLNGYLSQGCVFLPASGYYNNGFSNGGYYGYCLASSQYDTSNAYYLLFDTSSINPNAYVNKSTIYTQIHLVKNAVYGESTICASTKSIDNWTYGASQITLPYSVNAIDGHSSNYAKGSFTFNSRVDIKKIEPTYLWFDHADQSAEIYIDNVLVTTHWGGYNAFFVDITNYIHVGINNVKVILCNTTRSYLAPCAGDFNFNATLGTVKLITSPVSPSADYGYDGFHVSSDVSSSSATITIRTSVPNTADIICRISESGGNYTFVEKRCASGAVTFTATVNNPRLWSGKVDPHLYDISLEIYHNGDLFHSLSRGYGLRYYDYVFNDTSVLPNNEPYTGFLLNGSPYLLRGVCMHHDLVGKANALTSADIDNEFAIIEELGCNFIRLAHYPHTKEVYDHCDRLGIVVQTEVPWVNNAQSTQPSDYYTHLEQQYRDMVNQHYNHSSIMFWGLSNETTTDDKAFAKTKIEHYKSIIKSIDQERWVGYVASHSVSNPSSYFNNPDVDWFGCNIYVGWYIDKTSNNPTNQLNTRVANTITSLGKPLAFSEYGAGGTQHCHSENPMETTTSGNNPRHDIEYQMWLHEGHIAAIRNFPQLLFTSQWQLFDIAVSNRNEGYTICLDGETTSTDDNLRRLNNKGLVERDHITKKDTFYLYKAEWSQERFVHICGKDYLKTTNRTIKCYTNDGSSLSLYVDNVFVETASVSNNIVTFSPTNFSSGNVVKVSGATASDTFTIQ